MKKTTYFGIAYFVIILYLTSCNGQMEAEMPAVGATIRVTRPGNTQTPTTTVQPTHASLPTATPSPQATLTLSPTVAPSPTLTPTLSIQELCGTVYTDTQQFPPNLLAGVVYDDPVKYLGNLLIQGTNLMEPAFQWNEEFTAWATVSPNGQWLATVRLNDFDATGNPRQAQGIVFDPNSRQSYESELPDNWLAQASFDYFQWLNNQQLVSHTMPEKNDNQINYLVWSPFINKQEILTVNLPGYENRRVSDANEAQPTLDPLLEYIAYPCYDKIVCQGDTFRILNIATGEVIWSTYFRFHGGFLDSGLWSFDGQKLAIFTKDEQNTKLFILNRDQETIKTFVFDGSATSRSSKWSPNSHFLIFHYTNQAGYRAMYVDMNGTITDFCTPIGYGYYWAPDSTKIVYDDFEDIGEEGFRYFIYVLDISSGNRYLWFEPTLPNRLHGWALPVLTEP